MYLVSLFLALMFPTLGEVTPAVSGETENSRSLLNKAVSKSLAPMILKERYKKEPGKVIPSNSNTLGVGTL